MTATTHSDFDAATEAVKVAAAFPEACRDRTVLITGVNKKGIGFTTAEAFASQSPRRLVLAGRSEAKVQECIDSLRSEYPALELRFLQLDLSSQKSVRSAAAQVLEWADVPSIDLLINNAGLMFHGAKRDGPVPRSEDGVEILFATNHLGHFLFTNLIMPKLVAAAKSNPPGVTRIINLSSSGVHVSPLRASDIAWEKPTSQIPENEKPNLAMMRASMLPAEESTAYIPTAAYGHSKTCNVLFAVGLNERLFTKHGILSLAVNPGEIRTELIRHTDPDWLAKVIKMRDEKGLGGGKSQTQGASTTLVAACDPKLSAPDDDGNGQFLSDCQIAKAPPHAVNKGDAETLWHISEDLTGQKFVL